MPRNGDEFHAINQTGWQHRFMITATACKPANKSQGYSLAETSGLLFPYQYSAPTSWQVVRELNGSDKTPDTRVNGSEPGSSVSIVSGWLGDGDSIPGRDKTIFPVASVSRPALGPTQPPVQCVPGVLSPGVKRGWGVTLITRPHLVPRSRKSRSYTSSPPKRLHGV
jgi:hypothetical protein